MRAILFFICCFLLLSCNRLEEGVVTQQWYEPEKTDLVMIPIIISSGKVTSVIMVPHFVTDNEDFCVKIKGVYKGEIREETLYLNESQYKCLSIGSHFKVNENCSLSDDNNIKVEK